MKMLKTLILCGVVVGNLSCGDNEPSRPTFPDSKTGGFPNAEYTPQYDLNPYYPPLDMNYYICATECAGCCDGEACIETPTNEKCGKNGEGCIVCDATKVCKNGACETKPPEPE